MYVSMYISFETGALVGLELVICLLQPLQCWIIDVHHHSQLWGTILEILSTVGAGNQDEGLES
jgi:hypothetical protein